MQNTQLYIENQLVELDEQVHFAITRQFEDLTNPTDIINDWSKTVSIPGTAANNRLFGNIYNPNMTVYNTGGLFVQFDPTRKLDFRLMYSGSVLMDGYAKMTEIKQTKGQIRYSITLNGTIGKLFQELNKIRFDKVGDTSVVDDASYIIDTSQYFRVRLNNAAMYDFFSMSQSTLKVGNPSLHSYDYVGFSPNLGYSSDFDYNTFQVKGNQSYTFQETLTNHQPKLCNMISADTIYPNGLKPREIGEFRTYNQLPYIYINKLYQIVNQKFKSLTGVEMKTNSPWLNNDNPYWFDAVMMLQPLEFNEQNKSDILNTYNQVDCSIHFYDYNSSINHVLFARQSGGYNEVYPIAQWNSSGFAHRFDGTSSPQAASLSLQTRINASAYLLSDGRYSPMCFEPLEGGIVIVTDVIDNNGNHIQTNKYLACHTDSIIDTSGYDNVYYYDDWNLDSSTHYRYIDVPTPVVFAENVGVGNNYRINVDVSWNGGTAVVQPLYWRDVNDVYHAYYPDNSHPIIIYPNGGMTVNFLDNSKRSNGYITISDLWNHEKKPWEVLLNYFKMMRLCLHYKRSLTGDVIDIKPVNEYFKDYKIIDWTKKLDMNKDFTIKPVYWQSKNVLFNYEDTDNQLTKSYKDKYGWNWGEKNIITNYNFDTNTTDLFSGIYAPMIYTPNVLSWTNPYDNALIAYVRPTKEVYVNSQDDDGNTINPFGQFFLHCGQMAFNVDNQNLRPCYLSDDTNLMIANSKYFYNQNGQTGIDVYLPIYSYQHLNIAKGANLITFEKPLEQYDVTSISDRNGLYYNLWQRYIQDRYAVTSKEVTCYVNLQPLDFINFEFNHFVQINNQLYCVNKIYDYDVMSSESTKVDLITINDINNYTKTNYRYIDGHIEGDDGDDDYHYVDPSTIITLDIDTNDDATWAVETNLRYIYPSKREGIGCDTITLDVSTVLDEGEIYPLVLYRTDSSYGMSEREHRILYFKKRISE